MLRRSDEWGPERSPFRKRERAPGPSLGRDEDPLLLPGLEPDLLKSRHLVLLRGEASLQWGCLCQRAMSNERKVQSLQGEARRCA